MSLGILKVKLLLASWTAFDCVLEDRSLSSLIINPVCRGSPVEPADSGVTGDNPAVAAISIPRQPIENIQLRKTDTVQDSQAVAGNTENLLTTFLQGFMTVAWIAKHLSVSRSTVYHLCEVGELEHVRVSNAIRVPFQAVAAYVHRRGSRRT